MIKKIAYCDLFAGVSGDMILGALVDAGLELKALSRVLRRLPLKGYRLTARRVTRSGIAGTRVNVVLSRGAGKGVRGVSDILSIIRRAGLPGGVAEKSARIFELLGRAETRVHGSLLARSHLHELGGADAVVDVVGSVAGLHLLGIEEVYASAVPWNRGTVRCAHGTLPVPAPAVAELVKGMPVYSHPVAAEMVTPTGIAIIRGCAREVGGVPPHTVRGVGYGAGEIEFREFPNMLRLVIGEVEGGAGTESVAVLECAIDDMSPTLYNYLSERLFAAGALDVVVVPVLMKKNRPGQLLSVLCRPRGVRALAEIILSESTTTGVRVREERRFVLPREMARVRTPYGVVRVKRIRRPDGSLSVAPEYDDCARVARAKRIPLQRVIAAARRA
ncbi:MAG: nickel pincer cofactor biosynthesis protein LarC [Candidatus Aureabacteria bacterium]|nr:nickel pincer cofactor biosynthesis protein LarC [Candidatus Auribacterota bacterium]